MRKSEIRNPQSAMEDSAIRNPQSAIEHVVVIGASAGGIEAVMRVLSELPGDLPAAVIVVQHLKSDRPTGLPDLLHRKCSLDVRLVENGIPLKMGTVYVAEPGLHICIEEGCLIQNQGELVNYVRPSADILFVSAAEAFGKNVIGVVLSGTGHDGTRGCKEIKARGGITIAQDEKTSRHFGMPNAAIEAGAIDYVLPVYEIGKKILNIVSLH